jgi:tetratricopeptide repeat protein 21B
MAQEMLKECIKYNKSCSKAYDYLGFIHEKDGAYKDAAANYEQAWMLANSADPSIGYRLAFNHFKASKYVHAIQVCQRVLATTPDYPNIRVDILDKARKMLRA